jgi:hypothetical protein
MTKEELIVEIDEIIKHVKVLQEKYDLLGREGTVLIRYALSFLGELNKVLRGRENA